jgi:hypothetical protein
MTIRRDFVFGASAALICAPAIVRAHNLMPLRGIILPTEPCYFGFTDRLYVHWYLPKITELQNAGLSLHEVAAEFSRRRLNNTTWDGQRVMAVIKRDKLIRRIDLERRLRVGSIAI